MSNRPIHAVSIRNLVVRFGAATAVDDISLDIRPGEVFALLGPNGAGKATTMRALTTLLPPTAGSASVFGVDVSERHALELVAVAVVVLLSAAFFSTLSIVLAAMVAASLGIAVASALLPRLARW
jgi:ABC-type multidrug transport system ATPase subunit